MKAVLGRPGAAAANHGKRRKAKARSIMIIVSVIAVLPAFCASLHSACVCYEVRSKFFGAARSMSAVFVKNLPFDMGEAAVQELFESSVGGEKFSESLLI